ncbi:hypothetical protein L208DRAFT_1409534 [Tricholoma matsutake]|nr:hypothetical protein L208DRAFT_1409534 [Tricholoma matsutake 945]
MVPNWVQKSLDSAMEKELKIYKEEWLGMPSELVEHSFLSLKNAGKWVNLQQYELFLHNSIGQSVSKPIQTSPRKSQLKPVIKIEPNAESSNAHHKWAQEHVSNSEIVDIINSPDNKTKLVPKSEFQSMGGEKAASEEFPRDHEGRYIITRKAEVDMVYVLDFGDDARVSGRNVAKKPKGLDVFLKADDQGSWGRGKNSSTSHDIKLTLLDDLPAHCSVHEYNGAHQCEMFDNRFLDGYEQIDSYDLNKMDEILKARQTQNRADGETMLGITDVYKPNSQ